MGIRRACDKAQGADGGNIGHRKPRKTERVFQPFAQRSFGACIREKSLQCTVVFAPDNAVGIQKDIQGGFQIPDDRTASRVCQCGVCAFRQNLHEGAVCLSRSIEAVADHQFRRAPGIQYGSVFAAVVFSAVLHLIFPFALFVAQAQIGKQNHVARFGIRRQVDAYVQPLDVSFRIDNLAAVGEPASSGIEFFQQVIPAETLLELFGGFQ